MSKIIPNNKNIAGILLILLLICYPIYQIYASIKTGGACLYTIRTGYPVCYDHIHHPRVYLFVILFYILEIIALFYCLNYIIHRNDKKQNRKKK